MTLPSKTPIIGLTILVLLVTSALLVYYVGLFPAYVPYQLNEQFDRLDSNVWDIGGAKNFTVTNGALNLRDSTSVTHYFVTNPKYAPPSGEVDLQGSIEVVFKANSLLGRSVVVAGSDSWRMYIRDGILVVETTDRAPFLGGTVDSSWHRLVVYREAKLLQLRMDDSLLLQVGDWSGVEKRIELGSAQLSVGGLKVQGTVSVDSVTAELQPVTGGSQSAKEGYQVLTPPIIAHGNAHIDTSQSVFGGGSGAFLNDGDYLTIAPSDNWNFASEDFTIDFWARFNSLPATGTSYCIWTQGGNYPDGQYFFLDKWSDGSLIWEWGVVWGASFVMSLLATVQGGIVLGSWYHMALVRNGSNWYTFQNGVLLGNTTSSRSVPDYSSPLYIGIDVNTFHFEGWVDEFRISKGIARWMSNFTPPNSAYSPDRFTVLLLHMDGANGSTDFKDSSGSLAIIGSGLAIFPVSRTVTESGTRDHGAPRLLDQERRK